MVTYVYYNGELLFSKLESRRDSDMRRVEACERYTGLYPVHKVHPCTRVPGTRVALTGARRGHATHISSAKWQLVMDKAQALIL